MWTNTSWWNRFWFLSVGQLPSDQIRYVYDEFMKRNIGFIIYTGIGNKYYGRVDRNRFSEARAVVNAAWAQSGG